MRVSRKCPLNSVTICGSMGEESRKAIFRLYRVNTWNVSEAVTSRAISLTRTPKDRQKLLYSAPFCSCEHLTLVKVSYILSHNIVLVPTPNALQKQLYIIPRYPRTNTKRSPQTVIYYPTISFSYKHQTLAKTSYICLSHEHLALVKLSYGSFSWKLVKIVT